MAKCFRFILIVANVHSEKDLKYEAFDRLWCKQSDGEFGVDGAVC
jgi:hypothetical protein